MVDRELPASHDFYVSVLPEHDGHITLAKESDVITDYKMTVAYDRYVKQLWMAWLCSLRFP